eukprot:jgi/Mesvir1/16510/Mv10063-RA.1
MGLIRLLFESPGDIPALISVKYKSWAVTRLPKDPALAFCYSMLNRVSRSFAIVIQQLHPELRDPVCVFYLVLRALDTVEDDMSIPEKTKLPHLKNFHTYIYDDKFRMECGTGAYKDLMEKFPLVVQCFKQLNERYQKVIADITRRMGEGMAEFIVREVETVEDYDLYCHYVAGLVGLGLSRLFARSGLEDTAFEGELDHLSNSMGLFLQKTNIIRDYLEDILEEPAPRMFWPKEVWSKYANSLDAFKDTAKNGKAAVACLNHLVTDALRHAPDALEYMRRLRTTPIFRFCAIPQVMAIGTLALCYNNIGVFKGVVKLQRGKSARLMVSTNDIQAVYRTFRLFSAQIASKVDENDPNAKTTLAAVDKVQAVCFQEETRLARSEYERKKNHKDALGPVTRLAIWMAFAAYVAHTFGLGKEAGFQAPTSIQLDALPNMEGFQKILSVLLFAAVTVYLLLVSMRRL